MDSPSVWSVPSAGRGWFPPRLAVVSPRREWWSGRRWRWARPAARRTAARRGTGCSSTPASATATFRGKCIWWMHAHKGHHMEEGRSSALVSSGQFWGSPRISCHKRTPAHTLMDSRLSAHFHFNSKPFKLLHAMTGCDVLQNIFSFSSFRDRF